jgi:hypothetical protein
LEYIGPTRKVTLGGVLEARCAGGGVEGVARARQEEVRQASRKAIRGRVLKVRGKNERRKWLETAPDGVLDGKFRGE